MSNTVEVVVNVSGEHVVVMWDGVQHEFEPNEKRAFDGDIARSLVVDSGIGRKSRALSLESELPEEKEKAAPKKKASPKKSSKK